jgi:hypothetical protein
MSGMIISSKFGSALPTGSRRTLGGLIQKIRKKKEQLTAMRLIKLNDTRMLAGKIAELDLQKQLMMAIATGDVQRVSQLIRAGLNNGESVAAMLSGLR